MRAICCVLSRVYGDCRREESLSLSEKKREGEKDVGRDGGWRDERKQEGMKGVERERGSWVVGIWEIEIERGFFVGGDRRRRCEMVGEREKGKERESRRGEREERKRKEEEEIRDEDEGRGREEGGIGLLRMLAYFRVEFPRLFRGEVGTVDREIDECWDVETSYCERFNSGVLCRSWSREEVWPVRMTSRE
ncbi:hypothetical protein Tco_0312728 [Tanacetum coccineum]